MIKGNWTTKGTSLLTQSETKCAQKLRLAPRSIPARGREQRKIVFHRHNETHFLLHKTGEGGGMFLVMFEFIHLVLHEERRGEFYCLRSVEA